MKLPRNEMLSSPKRLQVPSMEQKQNGTSDSGHGITNSSAPRLGDAYVPLKTDIVSGRRGNSNAKHPGNQIFAQRVRDSLDDYTKGSSRIQKTIVVAAIISSLRCDGMRFIKFDPAVDKFVELTIEQIHAKVGHAIRDQFKHRTTRTKDKKNLKGFPLLTTGKQPRSSSLPSRRRPPPPPKVVLSEKTLKRRHSADTAEPCNIMNVDAAKFSVAIQHNKQSKPAVKEMALIHSRWTAIETTKQEQDNQVAVLEEQQHVVGKDKLSRVVFDLGHDIEKIKSNDFASRTPDEVLCLLAPLRQKLNAIYRHDNSTVDGQEGISQPASQSASTSCVFSRMFTPLPLDAETKFETQDVEALHDTLLESGRRLTSS